jgi:hypothetical protein
VCLELFLRHTIKIKKMKKILFAALTIMLIASCSKKDETPSVVYTKVSISKLTILNYPATQSNGNNWDNSVTQGTYPDVYFEITQGTNPTPLYSLAIPSRKENLRTFDLPDYWSGSGGAPFCVVNDLNNQVYIDLWDYDYATTDQFMGLTGFVFSDYTTGSNKYPSTVTTTNGSTSIQLDLIWIP